MVESVETFSGTFLRFDGCLISIDVFLGTVLSYTRTATKQGGDHVPHHNVSPHHVPDHHVAHHHAGV